MRIIDSKGDGNRAAFLSIQAQDFIEDSSAGAAATSSTSTFLSIQAQDFIEERHTQVARVDRFAFLSIQAQDFIEEDGRGLPSLWPSHS